MWDKISQMTPEHSDLQIEAELERAEQFRRSGFEGRARVCARRAAGWAIALYFARIRFDILSKSNYALIQMLSRREETQVPVKYLCGRLLMKVDEDFKLPGEIDLIKDARDLIGLLNNTDNGELYMEEPQKEILLYGTSWCYDTRRSRALLDKNNISYLWIDIDKDPEGRKFVESVNRGFRSVPTIVFPDGAILTEPSDSELSRKLEI